MPAAGVAELVDALDLGSSDESCGGSSPSARTKRSQRLHEDYVSLVSEGYVYPGGFGAAEPPTQAERPCVDQIHNVRAVKAGR